MISKELLSAILNKNVTELPKKLDYSVRMHTPGIISANPASNERYNKSLTSFYKGAYENSKMWFKQAYKMLKDSK